MIQTVFPAADLETLGVMEYGFIRFAGAKCEPLGRITLLPEGDMTRSREVLSRGSLATWSVRPAVCPYRRLRNSAVGVRESWQIIWHRRARKFRPYRLAIACRRSSQSTRHYPARRAFLAK